MKLQHLQKKTNQELKSSIENYNEAVEMIIKRIYLTLLYMSIAGENLLKEYAIQLATLNILNLIINGEKMPIRRC